MSMDTVEGSGSVTEAPAAPVTEAPAGEAPAAEPGSDFASWPREDLEREVAKLRREDTNRRHKLKSYDEAFGALDPNLANDVMDFVRAVGRGDGAAYSGHVARWAEQVGLTKAQAEEVIAEATDDGDEPLTRKGLMEALAKLQAEQAQGAQKQAAERAQQEWLQGVRDHVKSLGYDEVAEPISFEALWGLAARYMRESRGSLDAKAAFDQAHEALDGWRTQIIDEYRAGKRSDSARVVSSPGASATAVADNTPTDLEEASKRARARIAAGQ